MLRIQNTYENEIVIEKSRFSTRIFRVNDIDMVNSILEEIRKKHYDATHNCYAYILGDNQEIVQDEAYYYGDDIFFEYKGNSYFWSSDDRIYANNNSEGVKYKGKPILIQASKLEAGKIAETINEYMQNELNNRIGIQ